MSERSAVILPNAVPVIQAPMAGGPSTPALTAAVCDAGGYGFVAAGYQSADALQQAIVETRTLTGEPFGVNVFVPSVPGDRSVVSAYASTLQEEAEVLGVALGDGHWDDDHYDAKLDVIASNSVHLASFTFGCPTPEVVDRLHRADVLVAVTVTSVPESLMATGTGADLLIAQGAEAGGHQGSFDDLAANQIPLLSLLAEILETTDLPVVGSGGIMTGSDTAAVLTAGAVAVQFGTVFLCTPEAGTSSPYRRALLDRIYSETIVTRAVQRSIRPRARQPVRRRTRQTGTTRVSRGAPSHPASTRSCDQGRGHGRPESLGGDRLAARYHRAGRDDRAADCDRGAGHGSLTCAGCFTDPVPWPRWLQGRSSLLSVWPPCSICRPKT